jgi:hypothetical protein
VNKEIFRKKRKERTEKKGRVKHRQKKGWNIEKN